MGNVKITGQKELEKKLKQLSDAARTTATQEVLNTGAVLVHGEAVNRITQQRAVDTGNLRSSLNFSVSEDEAEVGTPVEYAPYVEYGTSRMAARPYLRPALDENIGKLVKLASDIFAKHLTRS